MSLINYVCMNDYSSYVKMLRLIYLAKQLVEVVDFVTTQEEVILEYNMKIYQFYNQEFSIYTLIILLF